MLFEKEIATVGYLGRSVPEGIDLKEAIHHIGSITGNIDNDQDILGAIFSQFCIGK